MNDTANPFVIIAPGRICLFGEHQDYLGLPVIAAAINLHLRADAERRETSGFVLDLSTDKIERMLAAAMNAGALGGKINGSGGGGCMFAYAPGHEQDVADAISREGGVPYIVQADAGVRHIDPGPIP